MGKNSHFVCGKLGDSRASVWRRLVGDAIVDSALWSEPALPLTEAVWPWGNHLSSLVHGFPVCATRRLLTRTPKNHPSHQLS